MKRKQKENMEKLTVEESRSQTFLISASLAILLAAIFGTSILFFETIKITLHQIDKRLLIALCATVLFAIIAFFILLAMGMASIRIGKTGPGWRVVTLAITALISLIGLICLAV
jgi:hypothetical protein